VTKGFFVIVLDTKKVLGVGNIFVFGWVLEPSYHKTAGNPKDYCFEHRLGCTYTLQKGL